ncbi:SH3 domain-containing protein [Maribacter sp. BPC-D8]|uniref:SH3 domain-containing protein n=1 Tax=Maribacter sp. BPC-D8 TaxID=3053613 RepID=UPI002B48875C|nr:SH3 domain-containing protein [Maribacter sp. BPC-D8]WRI31132.1 SH3 domain-containing protein [Maribacter sp. BPC-D8]
MKKVIYLFFLLNYVLVWSQDYYFSNATSGLILRKEATINSERIGKLTYGTLCQIIEETDIKYTNSENNEKINSEWVKIKYDNFPFLDINDKEYDRDKTGYVVKEYLENLNKSSIKIVTRKIDSLTFFTSYKKTNHAPTKLIDLKEIEKMLSGRVKWIDNPMADEGREKVIKNIFLPNGQILNLGSELVNFDVVAYYPSEEILLFVVRDTIEFSISIKTGETINTIGNPEYILHSPSRKYRLNGWFSGQECGSYFFQEKKGNDFVYLTDFLTGTKRFDKDKCSFDKFYWVSDDEFIYSYIKDNGIKKYIKAKIKTKKKKIE